MRIGLDYKHVQLKNKWDKLKSDYNILKKLKLRKTGAGWDNIMKHDNELWKKAKILSSHAYVLHIIMYPYHFIYY
jgi:hypothetical protein